MRKVPKYTEPDILAFLLVEMLLKSLIVGPARAVLSHLLDQQEFRKNNLSY